MNDNLRLQELIRELTNLLSTQMPTATTNISKVKVRGSGDYLRIDLEGADHVAELELQDDIDHLRRKLNEAERIYGDRDALENEISHLEMRLKDSFRMQDELSSQKHAMTVDRDRLEIELARARTEVNLVYEERDTERQQLRDEINRAHEKRDELRGVLTTRDSEITNLAAHLNEARTEVNRFRLELKAMRSDVVPAMAAAQSSTVSPL